MYGYIYKTINVVNGKFYIGQKKSNVFLKEKYLGSGVRLKDAVRCYGKNNFIVEMLDIADNQNELDAKEIYWISFLNARDPSIAYNLAEGGNGGFTGEAWNKGLTKEEAPSLIQSDSAKRKRSESLKKAYKEGRHSTSHSQETRDKMSRKAKEREHPPTTAGRVYYTNGVDNKCIALKDIPKYESIGWHKGKTVCKRDAWNKGLTKETDERVSKYARTRKEIFNSGKSIGCYGVKDNLFSKGETVDDYHKRKKISN